MSTHEKDQRWQAYIDGELTSTEMADFENSLSPGERELLMSDIQFERGIVDKLSEGGSCPDEVWKCIKDTLLSKDTDDSTQSNIVPLRRKPWRAAVVTLVAAASIAFVISIVAPGKITPGLMSAPTVLAADTVEALANQSEVEPNRLVIQDFMHKNDVTLDLLIEDSLPISRIHSGVHLVGAATKEKGAYVELYAGCCSRPVKLVIARRDSKAGHALGYATGPDSEVQATRIVGDYLVAVVGQHPAHGLLDIFEGQHP